MESNIQNYMEILVNQRFLALDFHQNYTRDQITDMKCITLNQLPALYIRHSVDMLVATSEQQSAHYHRMVAAAVENAEKMIANDRRAREDDMDDKAIYHSLDRFELEDKESPFVGKLHIE